MNRIDICKNIIQSIKEYITIPEKLEPHRAKNHFTKNEILNSTTTFGGGIYSRTVKVYSFI